MQATEKLKKYIDDQGYRLDRFAQKMGMRYGTFMSMLSANRAIPDEYWEMAMRLTQGEITLEDLVADKFRNVKSISVNSTGDQFKCEVIIKIE